MPRLTVHPEPQNEIRCSRFSKCLADGRDETKETTAWRNLRYQEAAFVQVHVDTWGCDSQDDRGFPEWPQVCTELSQVAAKPWKSVASMFTRYRSE